MRENTFTFALWRLLVGMFKQERDSPRSWIVEILFALLIVTVIRLAMNSREARL